jgi:hypothetical protein
MKFNSHCNSNLTNWVRVLTIHLVVIQMKFDISKLYLFLIFQIGNSIVYNLLGDSY